MRFLLLWLLLVNVSDADLSSYRKLMDQSLNDEDTADRFYEKMKTIKEDREPILVGFRAMSEFLLCKHTINPLKQLNHFNKGKKLLENAIKREPLDPELLYFRFTTQSNVPAILKYKTNISEDKLNLIRYLKSGPVKSGDDKILHGRIKTYLLTNTYCSAAEKAMIKTL